MRKFGIRNGLVLFLMAFLLLGLYGCQHTGGPPPEGAPAINEVEAGDGKAAGKDKPSLSTLPATVKPDVKAQEDAGDPAAVESAAAGKNGVDKAQESSNVDSVPAGAVSLLVSRDYGRQNMIQKQIALEAGWSVLDVLKSAAQVTTKWDGGFIHGIDGLEMSSGGLSGVNRDWFYFVNGICADVGAFEYTLQAGEKVWCDYHAWGSTGMTNPAVIGCYPEPFVHGYRGKISPTTIMSSEANSGLGQLLQQALRAQGVAAVDCVAPNNDLLQKPSGPIIVLGTWGELETLPNLKAFNKAFRKNGTSVHFQDDAVELLDGLGKAKQTLGPGTGVIVASAAGLGNYQVLWLVSGTDQAGLQLAVDVLTKRPQQLNGFYHAAVTADRVLRLPLE